MGACINSIIYFQKRNTKGHDMAAIGKTALPGLWIGFTGIGWTNKPGRFNWF
jgi:hypothetical protein